MYVEFLHEFNEGKGYTSWILSLMTGTMLCSGKLYHFNYLLCRTSLTNRKFFTFLGIFQLKTNAGPISSSFVNKYGCRVVAIAGSLLTSACLFASYYATNVITLIVTIGKEA